MNLIKLKLIYKDLKSFIYFFKKNKPVVVNDINNIIQ